MPIMTIGVPLNALKAVEAVGRLGSVTAAAVELGISQPAVSQRLRQIEERLNLRLFERRGSGVVPTADAELLLPSLIEAFALIDRGLRLVSAGRGGPVTVSLLPSFAVHWLIPRLGLFQAEHAEIEVRLVTTAKLSEFRADGVDLAIRYGSGSWPGLVALPLMSEAMFPVAAPALAARLAAPAALAAATLIVVEAAARRDDWKHWLQAAGLPALEPRGRLQFENSTQALAAARAGLGVALAHRPFAADDLAAGTLVAPFALQVIGTDSYWVVHAEGQVLPRQVRLFRDWLLSLAGRSEP